MQKVKRPSAAAVSAKDWHEQPPQERLGFLIRRLHQIHVTLFIEERAKEKVTPAQYSILSALDHMGTAEQIALSRAVGLDATNVADVLARLERRKLIKRRVSRQDKRMKVVTLTAVGHKLLQRIDVSAARAHVRTLAVLTPKERARFIRDLSKLVAFNNDISRTPVGLRRSERGASGRFQAKWNQLAVRKRVKINKSK